MPGRMLCEKRLRGSLVDLLAVAGILVMAVSGANATEYFVAKGGKDGNDGRSEQNAFAAIKKGVSGLKAGDVLTILPGTYFESVSAQISGKPGLPITIRAKRPGTVLLRGDVEAPEFRRAEGSRFTYCADFAQRVEGIAERSTFRMYEPMLTLAEVEMNLATFHHDPQTGRLYVHTSDSRDPNWHALSISVTNGFGILLTPPGGSETVHDVIVDGLSFTGYQARDYPPPPGSRCRWGLHIVCGERVVVRRCAAFLNSGGIYLLAPTDSVVEDCHSFGNFSRFLDLGNNILGWSVSDTTFRRNTVEGFWRSSGPSNGDITFYGGARYDKKPTRGLMENNLAINAGLMIKGSFGQDTPQTGNAVVGRGAYFYRAPDATNLLLPDNESDRARQIYADPVNHDYRLQPDAPARREATLFPSRNEVFFVSPAGDDGARGTSLKQAWRTLARAAKNARPGDTVYVTAGEYNEALAPAQSGTAEKPIRFLRRGRDKVVLNGQGRLPVGVDLSDRSHVVIKGFVIRDFARHGVLAKEGEDLRIEQVVVTGSGGDGVAVSRVNDLVLTRNLIRDCKGAAVRMENSPRATITGNVFDLNSGPRIFTDSASLEGLWSDGNAFPPGRSGAALIAVGAQTFDSLEAWRKSSGLDSTSVAAAVGYRDPENPERADFALRPDSPLIGRGPNGATIGPYLRIKVETALPIEDVIVHSATDTTATVQWWTPTQMAGATLEWGDSPKCGQKIESPPGALHTVSLIGLRPGTKYFYRVTSQARGEDVRFAPYAPEKGSPAAAVAPEARVFETAAKSAAPRNLHVAVAGDDSRSGLSLAEAWRTIAHAADQARAGDTVLIHEGKYEEFVLVRATGDEKAPITFRAVPGECVWMEGGDRFRTTAFRLTAKHHIHIDGIRFRHFRYVPHAGDVINISGGSNHVIQRCFYDGREIEGYMPNFVRASDTAKLLVENCVMINGMGEGLVLSKCPEATVRNCVFYNNFIRALTAWQFDPKLTITLSHNLFCDNIPEKTANAFIRLSHLESLRSDHNGYFARKGPAERRIVEAANVGGKPAGHQGSGQYYGANFLLDEVQKQAGQENGSFFGNPGIRVVKELLPPGAPQGEWFKKEMQREGTAFKPWDFADFMSDPAGAFARAADGTPVGLAPQAFR